MEWSAPDIDCFREYILICGHASNWLVVEAQVLKTFIHIFVRYISLKGLTIERRNPSLLSIALRYSLSNETVPSMSTLILISDLDCCEQRVAMASVRGKSMT